MKKFEALHRNLFFKFALVAIQMGSSAHMTASESEYYDPATYAQFYSVLPSEDSADKNQSHAVQPSSDLLVDEEGYYIVPPTTIARGGAISHSSSRPPEPQHPSFDDATPFPHSTLPEETPQSIEPREEPKVEQREEQAAPLLTEPPKLEQQKVEERASIPDRTHLTTPDAPIIDSRQRLEPGVRPTEAEIRARQWNQTYDAAFPGVVEPVAPMVIEPIPTPIPAPVLTPPTQLPPAQINRPQVQPIESIQQATPPVSAPPAPAQPQSPPAIAIPKEPEVFPKEHEIPSTSISTSPAPESVGPINFNNVSMVEYIRFISRVSNKNFIYQDEDLQFYVTIVSEEPTTVDNLMTALLQELRIRNLSLIEQGNSIIVHRNPRIRSPGHVISDGSDALPKTAELVTRVFRLNTLDPIKATEIIKPLLSDDALVEVLRDSNNLIITDLHANVDKIARLIASLDAPNSGVIVGQYVVRNGFVDSLVDLATRILFPIAQGNPFVLVPHSPSNSIYVVSNNYIVEKAMAILQNLDSHETKTKIFALDKMQPIGYDPVTGTFIYPGGSQGGVPGIAPEKVQGISVPDNNPLLPPALESSFPPPRGPSVLNETSEFIPGGISAASRWSQELPTGHIERTVFFIYKLKYRRGDQIEVSLRKIASSLLATGLTNIDLVSAINSVQWIESSNSLIFTGTTTALDKIKDLILEVDTPLHQVFIEMLVLDTTLEDSLNYGVDWGVLFGGGNTAGGETFLTPPNNQKIINSLDGGVGIPNALQLLQETGFNLGIIGKHLTHCGTQFSTISALVRALHLDTKAHVVINPKIITEDNVTAEVFVGETDRYKTQSISNDIGSVITNNFQFIDVGVTLRVTPLIGNNGIITLDIIEEDTRPAAEANAAQTTSQDVNLVTVLRKSRTTTRVHVPNGYFLVLSGMLQDRDVRTVNQIPCLGCIPILGGAGKNLKNHMAKRNQMIFIRPLIVDTAAQLDDITRRQQDVYTEKNKWNRDWNYEIDQALDFFNIQPRSPDNRDCSPLK